MAPFQVAHLPCRHIVEGARTPSGTVGLVGDKLSVLLHVALVQLCSKLKSAKLSGAAMAALGALCAFTSPHRGEALAAVKELCSLQGSEMMATVLRQPQVLQRAERMLPGACATLMLTIAEVHLVHCGMQPGQPGIVGSHLLSAYDAVLTCDGPQMGIFHYSVWQAIMCLLPVAAAYTAALADSRPQALAKKCMLAVLLNMIAGICTEQIQNMAELAQLDVGYFRSTLASVVGPALQLALHMEQ